MNNQPQSRQFSDSEIPCTETALLIATLLWSDVSLRIFKARQDLRSRHDYITFCESDVHSAMKKALATKLVEILDFMSNDMRGSSKELLYSLAFEVTNALSKTEWNFEKVSASIAVYALQVAIAETWSQTTPTSQTDDKEFGYLVRHIEIMDQLVEHLRNSIEECPVRAFAAP